MAKKKKRKYSILQREVPVTDYLSTGSTRLDLAISCRKSKYGGIPTNRITELSGTGASGKTYVCGELCGDALRRGYRVFVDDIERRWDLSRLSTFGFEAEHENFHYLPPISSVEECFERMFEVVDHLEKGIKALYIVDPIAALIAEQEHKSDKMGQARAKAIQKHMRFLKDRVSTFSDPQLTVVFSNQLIDSVGQSFGPPKRSPGGNAMRHWPSVRVRFRHAGKITREKKGRKEKIKDISGVKLHASVIKNSEDDAYREAELTIRYGYGIDDIYDCAMWLKTHTKALGLKDSWFKMPKSIKNKRTHKQQNGIKNFVKYVEKRNLEKQLQLLTAKYYRRWYNYEERKPKVR